MDMKAIQELQGWVFEQLRQEIRRRDPELARDFEASPPEGQRDTEAWRARLVFPPIEPWNTIMGSLMSLRLGLQHLEFEMASLRTAADGRTAWFSQEKVPLAASSVLERAEDLAKRLSRGRNAPIDRAVADSVIDRLKNTRETPTFEPLRHYAAHGPQLGLGKGGWIEAAKNDRYWELIALNHEDAEDVVEVMLEASVDRRDFRHAALRPFVQAINELTENCVRRLLDSATSQRT